MLHRTLKRLGYSLAIMAILVALLLAFFNWNWLRHPIGQVIMEKTGRAFVINGNLNVKLGWPLIQIEMHDVTFANPAWAKQPLMFTLQRINASLSLPQLLKHQIWMPMVRLEHPRIFFEISPDGRKNWLLDRNQQDKNAQVKIGHLLLDDGQVDYLDSLHHTHIQATLSTRNIQPNAAAVANIMFAATGQFKGLPLIASGNGGPVLSLNDVSTPYPLTADVSLGNIRLHATGTITDLAHFNAVDLNLVLRGQSLDQLYPLIGIALPRTPAYTTQGHLLHSAKQWRYEKFTARVGKSDAAGNIRIDSAPKRPFLQGDLTFQRLDFADLGSLVGVSKQNIINAKAHHANPAPLAVTVQSAPKPNQHDILPDIPFRTQRWNSIDADVTVRAKHILRARALPIENLMTRIQMRDSVLTLDPLDFGVAGGTLAGTIMLNGQHDPIHAVVHIHARKLRLNQLFPTVKLTKTSVGQINGDFDLSANGNAVNQMLATADGKVALVVDSGEISKLMLETMGLHLLEMMELEVTGDKLIKLNCAIADFDVNQGVLETRIMILDTQISTITGSGDINMAQETLHLNLEPHTKVISPLALRSPIYIRGSFAKPEVSLDKTKLILRSASALALGLINPFLAIIPLVDTGPGENSACGKLIHEARRPIVIKH